MFVKKVEIMEKDKHLERMIRCNKRWYKAWHGKNLNQFNSCSYEMMNLVARLTKDYEKLHGEVPEILLDENGEMLC